MVADKLIMDCLVRGGAWKRRMFSILTLLLYFYVVYFLYLRATRGFDFCGDEGILLSGVKNRVIDLTSYTLPFSGFFALTDFSIPLLRIFNCLFIFICSIIFLYSFCIFLKKYAYENYSLLKSSILCLPAIILSQNFNFLIPSYTDLNICGAMLLCSGIFILFTYDITKKYFLMDIFIFAFGLLFSFLAKPTTSFFFIVALSYIILIKFGFKLFLTLFLSIFISCFLIFFLILYVNDYSLVQYFDLLFDKFDIPKTFSQYMSSLKGELSESPNFVFRSFSDLYVSFIIFMHSFMVGYLLFLLVFLCVAYSDEGCFPRCMFYYVFLIVLACIIIFYIIDSVGEAIFFSEERFSQVFLPFRKLFFNLLLATFTALFIFRKNIKKLGWKWNCAYSLLILAPLFIGFGSTISLAERSLDSSFFWYAATICVLCMFPEKYIITFRYFIFMVAFLFITGSQLYASAKPYLFQKSPLFKQDILIEEGPLKGLMLDRELADYAVRIQQYRKTLPQGQLPVFRPGYGSGLLYLLDAYSPVVPWVLGNVKDAEYVARFALERMSKDEYDKMLIISEGERNGPTRNAWLPHEVNQDENILDFEIKFPIGGEVQRFYKARGTSQERNRISINPPPSLP